ncbi:MAG: dihydrofolate reductase family protein [Methanoregulaceae archaeon]|nr:dihydrofolate reductase family protein [Methanoregulaceae archaeon]
MRKILSFTNISVDGFFAGPDGGIDWFKPADDEERKFSGESSKEAGTLVFGRTTYEMMAQYWPTPEARKNDPITAGVLNSVQKIVFSKTMKPVRDGPVWKNVRVLREIVPEEILRLKEVGEGGIAILGSGTIVRQFANLGLIDEYGLMVNPVVLGAGRHLFQDVNRMNLELLESRTFGNGNVYLRYRPV